MDKFLFTAGSTLAISGSWGSGDVFSTQTTIVAVIEFNSKLGRTVQAPFSCTVTLTPTGRDFQIYAGADSTASWPKGVHTLRIKRIDADHFPNHDPLVDVLEPVMIEVR